MKKLLISIMAMTFAAGLICSAPMKVYADEAADEYLKAAQNQVVSAQSAYDTAKAAADTAKAQYDQVVASGVAGLEKQQAYDAFKSAEDKARWYLDQLDNAKVNLTAAQGRKDQSIKNELQITDAQAKGMQSKIEAIMGYKDIAEGNDAIKGVMKGLVNDVCLQQAITITELSMEYEYEDPHNAYDNFVFTPEYSVELLNPSTLKGVDATMYQTWKNGKEGLSDAQIKEVSKWMDTIENAYIAYRGGKSQGAYLDAVCKSIDNSYLYIYRRWWNDHAPTNDIETRVMGMLDKIYYAKIDTLAKYYRGENLTDREEAMVVQLSKYDSDFDMNWSTPSTLHEAQARANHNYIAELANEYEKEFAGRSY